MKKVSESSRINFSAMTNRSSKRLKQWSFTGLDAARRSEFIFNIFNKKGGRSLARLSGSASIGYGNYSTQLTAAA